MHQFIGSESEATTKKKRKSKTQDVTRISRKQELDLYKSIHYKPRPLIKKEEETKDKPVIVSKYDESEDDEEQPNTVPVQTTPCQIPTVVSRPKVKDTLSDSGIQ